MSVNIQAPPIRAPRVSLLTAADIITITGDKWYTGIELYPLSGLDVSGLYPVCPMGSESKEATNRVGGQSFQPFAVYATDNCSTFGSGGVDFINRAKSKLDVVFPWWIEREFWEGTLGTNTSLVGGPHIDVNTPGDGQDPNDAFTLLDSAVANDLHDGRGMIHMTTAMFTWLYQHDLFRREGNVWYSPLDNIVVPGRGYTGNGGDYEGDETPQTGSQTAMFGHPGIVQIVRGDVLTYPEDESSLEKQMNRAVNDIWVTAERVAGYVVSNGSGTEYDEDDEEEENPIAVTGFYRAFAFTPYGISEDN